MSAQEDGGPAFPQYIFQTGRGSGLVTSDELGCPGMSLRDWFAAHVEDPGEDVSVSLAEELAGRPRPEGSWGIEQEKWAADWIAAWKFMRADALLKARSCNER